MHSIVPASIMRIEISCTHPPLNAPTGFLTGKGAATSASLREDVWKLRVARIAVEGEERARIDGDRIRDAMAFLVTSGSLPWDEGVKLELS